MRADILQRVVAAAGVGFVRARARRARPCRGQKQRGRYSYAKIPPKLESMNHSVASPRASMKAGSHYIHIRATRRVRGYVRKSVVRAWPFRQDSRYGL